MKTFFFFFVIQVKDYVLYIKFFNLNNGGGFLVLKLILSLFLPGLQCGAKGAPAWYHRLSNKKPPPFQFPVSKGSKSSLVRNTLSHTKDGFNQAKTKF